MQGSGTRFEGCLFEVGLGVDGGGAVLGGGAGFFYGLFGDLRGTVVPVLADVGGDVGEVLVADGGILSETGHGGEGGVFFTTDGDGTHEAVEEDAGETGGVTGDPVGFVEWWSEVGESFAIESVAGDAAGFALVGGLTAFEGGQVIAFDGAGRNFIVALFGGVVEPFDEVLLFVVIVVGGEEVCFASLESGEGSFADKLAVVFLEEFNERLGSDAGVDTGEEAGLVDGGDLSGFVGDDGGEGRGDERVGERSGCSEGGGGKLFLSGVQEHLDVGGGEDVESFKAPEGVELAERFGGGAEEGGEISLEGGIAAFDDEALRSVAPPAVVVAEEGDEFLGGEVLEFWCRAEGFVFGFDAVDASEAVAGAVESAADVLFAEIGGDVGLVLDDAVVEIDDVEAAIGGGDGIDGAEAFVGGGEEFLVAVRMVAGEFAVTIGDADCFDEVAAGFGDEGGAVGFLGELVTAVDGEAAGSGGVDELVGFRADGVAAVAVDLVDVAAVDAGSDADGPDCVGADPGAHAALYFGAVVAEDGVGEEKVADEESAVIVVVEAAEVVLAESPLATEVGALHDPFAVDLPVATVGLGVVDPVVEAGEEGVAFVFHVTAFGVVGINDDRFAGGLVAVAGDEVEVGLIGVEDAVIEEVDGAGEEDFVEEDGALVDGAIVVGVFEDDDAALGDFFTLAVDVGHVAAHFADPHTTVAVELEGDWFFDEGFCDDGLDREAGGDLKGFEGVVDLEDGCGRDFVLGDEGIHFLVAFAVAFLGEEGGWETEDGEEEEAESSHVRPHY